MYNNYKMNKDILDNLDFFSNLTQKTLSAFHLSGTENDIYNEVKSLEDLLRNSRKRKLIKVEVLGSDSFKRYFSDDFTDIVSFNNLNSPSYTELSEEFAHIDILLNKKYSPILSLRLGKEIVTTDFIEISSPIEKIFFI